MASASFSFSNHLIAHKISSSPPQISPPTRIIPFRISSTYATAERTSSSSPPNNAAQTASFYDVLGIQIGADNHEIKSAYRKLARVLHPDVVASSSSSNGHDDATSSSADEFMRVYAAYATLSDPEKRAAYDSTIFRRRMRTAASLTASGYPEYNNNNNRRRRSNWETDQCW